ncbi:MAG: hypothetical protein ABL931_23305, partial [Usitatibacteraceae bacterium]
LGGIVFSPLLVAVIGLLGFPVAAAAIGLVMVVTIWVLADNFFSKSPGQLGLLADGDSPGIAAITVTSTSAMTLPGSQLWRNWQFISLAIGMALGLFAQVGLLAHLFSLLVPALGAQLAGFAAGAATASAIVGRTLFGWLMPTGADRRVFACASYTVQIVGSLAFLYADGENIPILFVGVILFGFGIGNATSLPPLIAQVEFMKEDVPRVVPMIVAVGQGIYAFAPATFGLLQEFATSANSAATGTAPYLFIVAATIQCSAVVAFLLGRQRT